MLTKRQIEILEFIGDGPCGKIYNTDGSVMLSTRSGNRLITNHNTYRYLWQSGFLDFNHYGMRLFRVSEKAKKYIQEVKYGKRNAKKKN